MGIGYFLGFAPPLWLRRAWQAPELRPFLGRAANLPRLPDTAAIVAELDRGASAALGAPVAGILLWDEAAGGLRDPSGNLDAADNLIGGRAFTRQEAVLSLDAPRDDPTNAEHYHHYWANVVLAAPITAGTRRLGALIVCSPRAPIFADDDLVLVQRLADQATVILESRALIDEAARMRARGCFLDRRDAGGRRGGAHAGA